MLETENEFEYVGFGVVTGGLEAGFVLDLLNVFPRLPDNPTCPNFHKRIQIFLALNQILLLTRHLI